MNTIHKFSMAIVAVVMIAGFSAFKMSEVFADSNKLMSAQKTWYFKGTNVNQVTLPEHYTDDPNDAPDCDEEKDIICTILAPDDGNGEPNLSLPGIQDLIDDAMATGDLNSVVQSFRSL